MNVRKGVLLSRWPIELAVWVSALVLLYFSNPEKHHHTLCPIGAAGFDWCPGCGLGRSIASLLQGDVVASVQMHVLGIPVLAVLVYRIYTLCKKELMVIKKKSYGSS